ncbi:MAG: hypothetical protein F6K54_33240 [Okeania sp. SIO3B5]|uniref:hypothetical protein n=1 Tax=Okeania sp. SIO3B5 TaxID=2607811 RepID=UPI0014001D0A|nr:hypothetical protein [Okeania sp. SIO3B5]NEO57510.1 hypothetical protein [Okeania sp. SIO3B5]
MGRGGEGVSPCHRVTVSPFPHGGDGEMGRWGDWEMGRWGDGEMGRWGDGETRR